MDRLIFILRLSLLIIFYVFFIVIYYLSLKKCIWRNDKSRIKPVLLSIISLPVLVCFESIILSYFVDVALWPTFEDYLSVSGPERVPAIALSGLSLASVYMILIIFYAWLTEKVFVKNRDSSIFFLYIMFNTLYIVSYRKLGSGEMYSIPYLRDCMDIAGYVIMIIVVWLFYRYDVRMLAEISGKRIKLNWKIFTIPPAVFTFIYAMSTTTLAYDKEMQEDKMLITLFVFSCAILFLFIWAFYLIIKNIRAADTIKTLSVEVMEALAHTIDAKDEYTKGHSIRVANYSRMIAEKMGLSEEECEDIYYMGLLHDLGKIGVPNEIINSPAKLTNEQYDVIKKHPELGSVILSEIRSRPDLVTGARWHHERYDGKGYPDGKSGDDIPLMARIIAVADSYDAMTSNRSYRNYLPQEAVRSELKKNSGTQFDPGITEYMIRIIDEDKEYRLHE